MSLQLEPTNQQQLQRLPMLLNLPEQVITELGQLFILKRFAPHEIVYAPEEGYEKVYLLIDGSVSLYQLNGIKRITIALLSSGDLFGDIHPAVAAVTDQGDSFAEARTSSLVGSAYKNEVFGLISRHPIIGLRIIDQLGKRLKEAEIAIQNLGLNNVGKRVISILVRHCQSHGRISENECIMDKEFTHEELSALVGSSREAVTRSLNDLKRKGIVSYRGNQYRVRLGKKRIE